MSEFLLAKRGLKRLWDEIEISIGMSKFLHFTRGSSLDCQIIDAVMMVFGSKKQKPRHWDGVFIFVNVIARIKIN